MRGSNMVSDSITRVRVPVALRTRQGSVLRGFGHKFFVVAGNQLLADSGEIPSVRDTIRVAQRQVTVP